MPVQKKSASLKALLVFGMLAALAVLLAFLPAPAASDPWTPAQTVQPADLVRELAAAKSAGAPVVVCAGFRTLFEGAHIPGATFHGSASAAQGLADLKKWAGTLPRETNLVVYCGCCPLSHCPNIRPAFAALREMGFTHLRVLILPTDFATDWVAKGYPIQKGL
ncbi:MAG: rhodanese-like domain-containing protein [Acidobacteriia bacterium]|nr:rhodanese-like domain-containing protein [Terriglobia bacterium]